MLMIAAQAAVISGGHRRRYWGGNIILCKCGCGESVEPPRKYVNKEHQLEDMMRSTNDKPRSAKVARVNETHGQMVPCKCGCGEMVWSPRVYANREHQLEHMLNGAAREMNALQPHEAKVRGGKTAGDITAEQTRQIAARIRARHAEQSESGGS